MIRNASPEETRLASVAREVRDGRTVIVFARDFAHPAEKLWRALTDPVELARWAPHTADRDLSTVGKVVFTFLGDADGTTPSFDVPGVVLIAARPMLLEHSWATDVLEWRLEPVSDSSDSSDSDLNNATTLTLRHTLAESTMASAVAAGWHLCLEVADAALAGLPTAPVRGAAALNHGWSNLNERYAAAMGVEPSQIDKA